MKSVLAQTRSKSALSHKSDCISCTAFYKVGGFSALVEKFPYATASVAALDANNMTCKDPPEDYMKLLRSAQPGKSDYPWTAMTFGNSILQIYYWCTDQVGVQVSRP